VRGVSAAQKRTVLEMDLISYSDIARTLEENLDVHAVKALHDQIQGFVDRGLSQLGLRREDVVFATAGDNAILIFDDAGLMHRAAAAVSNVTQDHNKARSSDLAQRWFRMGAATGEVFLDKSNGQMAGSAIARAVRLEAASDGGALIVDVPTFRALPEDMHGSYGSEFIVIGKRDERFPARRCTFIEGRDARRDRPSNPLRRSSLTDVWDLLDPNLQDAFALAYNKKQRERAERPTRISTRDLFQALARIDDESIRGLLSVLPAKALPETSELPLTDEKRLLKEDHLLSDCIEESIAAFAGAGSSERRIAPADIFVDIAKRGHGASVDRLREHGIGAGEIDAAVRSLGIRVSEPRQGS
jgi:class 3 adenylate cyclase